MRERAAQGAAVADLRVADGARDRRQERTLRVRAARRSPASACRVPAPIATSSPSSRTYAAPRAARCRSARSGTASRSFIIGSSECPPASSWRRRRARPSSATASSTESGRTYSNGDGDHAPLPVEKPGATRSGAASSAASGSWPDARSTARTMLW